MAFSIDGLVSGIDTTTIIEGLVALQKSQVDRLNLRKSEIVTQQTAFKGVEARLLSLRSTMSQLNRSTASVFESNLGTSNDESILTVNAGTNATEGTYLVRVNSLARAHQIGSQGFDSDSTTISEGTISFQVGDRPATEITIDTSNNTIEGLVTAINTQSDDMTASIIHDQATNADRILLTSKHTGESNAITVANSLAAGSGNIIRPDFTGLAIQEATNASIQLGSGPGAITAEYESNTVAGLIENVTLDLLSVDATKDVTIKISRDTEAAKGAIQHFVDEYNSLIAYIDNQTNYNAETGVASPLIGNRTINNLKNELGAMVTQSIAGLDSALNRFSQIGIDIGDKGELKVNSSKLDKALKGELDGIKPGDIKRLFSLSGESNNSNIKFILGSGRTESSSTAYQVDILQAAERGTITATNALAGSIVINSGNNELQITVDGLESETLTLSDGTYTQQEIADHVQSLINSSASLKNREVTVSLEGSSLEITSKIYGSSSEISSLSGSAITDLGFDGTEIGLGQDVAGSFVVDGVVETATGSGRVLIGDSDNENTADLQLRVTLDASQVDTGIEGEIQISRGITAQLDQFFGETLDPVTGKMHTAYEGYDQRIESLEASIARVNQLSESKTAYLIKQFTALERVLSELKSTSSFLSAQLTPAQ